jgi:GT2 family glycosyltransferase
MSQRSTQTAAASSEGSANHVAVVICSHNRPSALERCLQRLQQIKSPEFSVVVVDNAPNSSETKRIAAQNGADYVLSPVKGLSRARNIGARATKAHIIVYHDDDMLAHTDWFGSLLSEFADKDVMAVTGPMLAMDLIDATDVELGAALERAPWGAHRFEIDRSSPHWFERTNFGGIGDGNFAIRRTAFEQLQGFDERLGRGAVIDSGEEHYAYYKLMTLGLKIVYAPRAVVFHPRLLMNRDVLQKQITDAVAYGAFVAWHNPSESWRITKFLSEAIFRVRRSWRQPSGLEAAPLATRERLSSGLMGLSTFWRSVRWTPRRCSKASQAE